MPFIQQLKHLGLKDKEAAVYIAALQLGPSPVQNIARKANVVRATTYVILEDLQKKGLVTHYKEGKKTLFSAEPPAQLVRLIEVEEEVLLKKKQDLEEFLPEFQVLMKAAGGRPSVRYFEGKEGLRAMRQEIIMYSNSGDTILNFTPSDHIRAAFPQDESYKLRMAKKIAAKTIFTTRSKKLKETILARVKTGLTEYRFVPPEVFPSTSGLTIFKDRVAISTYIGNQMGVIIESQPMTEMMRRLFDLAWQGALGVEDEKNIK